jgi:hypothetical protein
MDDYDSYFDGAYDWGRDLAKEYDLAPAFDRLFDGYLTDTQVSVSAARMALEVLGIL